MGVIANKLLCVSLFILLSASLAPQAEGAERRQIPWPLPSECLNCVPLQFGELMMRIPVARIEKIAVLGSDQSAVHLVPRGAGKALVTFLTVPRVDFVGRYEQAKILAASPALSNKALLDRLFEEPAVDDGQLALIRRFEEIDKASVLLRSSRDGLHLFWIRHPRPLIDKVYIAVDGSETTYLIGGEITDELMEGILSHMRREATL